MMDLQDQRKESLVLCQAGSGESRVAAFLSMAPSYGNLHIPQSSSLSSSSSSSNLTGGVSPGIDDDEDDDEHEKRGA